MKQAITLCVALGICAGLMAPGVAPTIGVDARITVMIFALATALWIGGRIDDTYVALGAGLALIVTGVIDSETLFRALGNETVWLLICAFVLAAAVTRTGLARRAAVFLVSGATSVRQLVHLTTAALVVSAFAVPATSGRAALAMPVFLALAKVLADRRRVVVMLALLFPTVILLSAVATLIGAGAHLITVSVLAEATGTQIGFTRWLLLGFPLGLISAHLAAEVVLLISTRRSDRTEPVAITAEDLQRHDDQAITGPLSTEQSRCLALLATVVALWCSEPLHGLSPAIVALIGAVVVTSPPLGLVTLKDALQTVPWSLLLFMAATMAMGVALMQSGAADWLASGLDRVGHISAPLFLAGVVVVSTFSHLVLQSRSARSSVLVPIVVVAAGGLGVGPVSAALASTAAAGFCHTLPASAKPLAMYAQVDGVPTYTGRELFRVSAALAPLSAALVLAFALVVWPALGVPY